MTTADAPEWGDIDAPGYFRDDDLEVPIPDDDGAPSGVDEAAPIVATNEAEALLAADWHVEQITRVRRERAVLDAVFKAEFTRVQERYRNRLAALAKEEEWHAAPVRQLHARLREADDRRATIVLPHGTLKSRKFKHPRFDVVDEPTFLAWAKEHDESLVRKVEKPDMRRVTKVLGLGPVADDPVNDVHRAVIKSSGEVVPGVEAVIPDTEFTITTGEAA